MYQSLVTHVLADGSQGNRKVHYFPMRAKAYLPHSLTSRLYPRLQGTVTYSVVAVGKFYSILGRVNHIIEAQPKAARITEEEGQGKGR